MVRVRIAPSPTGSLHVGTARTALFNYLFARHFGGEFIIRIEDTDLERSDKKFEDEILDGLEWLGIKADEGPREGGPYAPYRQSERTETYRKHIEKLIETGNAFYCFHSEKELDEERKELLKSSLPPVHLCEYRNMERQEAEMLKEIKNDYIIRFKNHSGRKISFNDLIRKEVVFDSDTIGDFSVAKKNSVPLYNLAVVADDHDMRISHVIRGEDHISNTPKQILLIEALGLTRPAYAHIPLILGTDRSKLSKRHNATSIRDYKASGYLPETIFNFLALLGWHPENDKEILSRDDLCGMFSLERVQKAGAIFDLNKLEWMNGEYLRRKTSNEFAALVMPFLEEFLRNADDKAGITDEYLNKVMELEQPRIKKLSEVGETAGYFFKKPKHNKDLLRWKDMDDNKILKALETAREILSCLDEPISKDKTEKIFLEKIGTGDKGALLWPLRAALSGRKASAGPFEIIEILGKKESLRRLEESLKMF